MTNADESLRAMWAALEVEQVRNRKLRYIAFAQALAIALLVLIVGVLLWK